MGRGRHAGWPDRVAEVDEEFAKIGVFGSEHAQQVRDGFRADGANGCGSFGEARIVAFIGALDRGMSVGKPFAQGASLIRGLAKDEEWQQRSGDDEERRVNDGSAREHNSEYQKARFCGTGQGRKRRRADDGRWAMGKEVRRMGFGKDGTNGSYCETVWLPDRRICSGGCSLQGRAASLGYSGMRPSRWARRRRIANSG